MKRVDECKYCGSTEIYVCDSRILPNGMRKRARECMECLQKTYSYEVERTEYEEMKEELKRYRNILSTMKGLVNGDL